ncbi:MAG: hypothetical protein KGZ58_01095 [Ignavibacteriales bacterium]|nr:hypothetical protein [Ignavibacteriales bacterium]
MNLSLEKIKETFPFINEKAYTSNDFWRVAKSLKIIVKEEPLLIDGYYKVEKGKPVILINIDLPPVEWTLTAFHELVHHLLDFPYKKSSVLLYRDVQKMQSIQEERAEAIALILMIPILKLKELEETPFDQPHPFTQKVLVKRQRIFERFGV